MGLGKTSKVIFVSIKDGSLCTKDESGNEQQHDYLEGRLVGVSLREKEFSGKKVNQYYFDFKDDQEMLFTLSTGEKGGVARSLLNSLASIKSAASTFRVITYAKNGYNKVRVYENGEPLNWKYQELPAVEEKVIAGEPVRDESKRLDFFREMAKEISSKVGA